MRARSNLTATRMGLAALAVLTTLASTLSCAASSHQRDNFRSVARRAAAAREKLEFGLAREFAIDFIGRSEVEPPWKNDRGLGPATIRNPFDSDTVTSPIGEEYEIVRFYIEATGNPNCPFIQGRLKFEPLIFINDKLVGWSWSYLGEVLGQRISPKKTGWEFGAFCDSGRANPPEPTTSDATSPATD